MGASYMSEAITAYRHVAASPEFRELERMRSKARHDEAQALYYAEKRGEKRGAERERANWQDVVAEKDTAIAGKDTEIEELRKQLESLRSQL